MNSHIGYSSLINEVESVLISQKLPTKLLSDTKLLVQSKHVNDHMSELFTQPSHQILQKLSKINNCIDPITIGRDSNANIKAFIIVSLEIAFNYSQSSFQSFFINKISSIAVSYSNNSNDNITNTMNNLTIDSIKNHNHNTLSSQSLIRVVIGFLNTLSNKKLKNPNMFDIKQQLQNVPIMLDYLILIIRTILSNYGVENADDYQKVIKDNELFTILSQYFDINYIKKDSFYFFQQQGLFIYKHNQQYVIGKYITTIENRQKKSNSFTSRKRSIGSNKFNNSLIMQCSDQGSILLVSSRHDQSTPCFNEGNGQFVLCGNEKKYMNNDSIRQQQGTQNIKNNSNNNSANISGHNKSIQSKSSGFEVNIYSQDRDKFFNTKYKSTHDSQQIQRQQRQLLLQQQKIKLVQSHKQKMFISGNHFNQYQTNNNKGQQKLQFFNNAFNNNIEQPTSAKNINNNNNNECFKKLHSDRNYFNQQQQPPPPLPLNASKTNNNNTKLLYNHNINFNSNECSNHHSNNNNKLNNSLHDKIFQWQNQDRRLRRVQTICYKTCSTCHRRFYRNQIQSNVLEVKIINNIEPKIINQQKTTLSNNPQQINNSTTTPATLYFKNNTPQFLNKKFNKKPFIENGLLIDSPKSKNQVTKIKSPQKQKQKINSNSNNANSERFNQFNWLNKRLKTQEGQKINNNANNVSMNTFPLTTKQPNQPTTTISPKNNNNYKQINNQQPKKALSNHNLFTINRDHDNIHNISQQKSPKNHTPTAIKSKVKQNRKFSDNTYNTYDISGLKSKYFTGLRSEKELKDKFVFNKMMGGNNNKVESGDNKDNKDISNKALENTNNSTVKDNSYTQAKVIIVNPDNQVSQLNKVQGVRSQGDIKLPQQHNNKPIHNNTILQHHRSIQKKLPKFMTKKDSINTQLKLIINNNS